METPHRIDLTIPEHAYFFGFVQGDGHISRSKANPNKGKLQIELSVRDEDILQCFHAMFPEGSISHRHRATNFADEYDSVTWRMCRQGFRDQLEDLGVPVGSKSLTVAPPTVPFSLVDYWRGFLDADGSLGITAKGFPYVSLVTTSEPMARAFEAFLCDIVGKQKRTARNARDSAFNVMVTKEDAVKVAALLYYPGCLGLNRKLAKAHEVVAWVRPSSMKQVFSTGPWTAEQDAIVASTPVREAARQLGRSESSVANRRFRLQKAARDQSAEGAA